MRVLCLFFPRFAIQVALRQRPHLDGRPLAVLDGCGEDAVVVAASCEATSRGITTGMTAARARTSCPAALFLPDNAGACLDELERIGSILRLRATPLVAAGGRDHLFVDLQSVRNDGNEGETASRLAGIARSWSPYSLRAGVGATREEALEAARATRRTLAICPLPTRYTQPAGDLPDSPPIVQQSGTVTVSAKVRQAARPVEVRELADRLLARADLVLAGRGESYREVRVRVDRGENAALVATLRLRNPRHTAAGVLTALGPRISDEMLEGASALHFEFGRLGPDVRVRPLGDAGTRRAATAQRGEQALRRAS
jgi:hypothetical protein